MLQKDTLIKVLNRDNGSVCYSIPEMNGLRRVYQSGETKQVTFEELQKLSYIPGGMTLLKQNLVILNDEAVNRLLGHVEPEYRYTEADVRKIMQEGSLDQFLDCLDFAPDGVKELIKTLAVEMPLNDVNKREAIFNKLGFNVDNAIRIKKESEQPVEVAPAAHRRVQITQTPTVSRRVVKS